MQPLRASVWWSLTIICGLAAGGCQVYLSGGPAPVRSPSPQAADHTLPPPAPATPPTASEDWHTDPAPDSGEPPAPTTAWDPNTPTAPPAAPRRVSRSTFPGERYYQAGQTLDVLDAVEDVLQARDFKILSSGVSEHGGEVHAERREQLVSPPRTTTSAKWKIEAAVIQIAGSTWDDCCYVRAAYTTTRLNSRGDVLGTTSADEPENHVLRSWFFNDLGTLIPVEPTR